MRKSNNAFKSTSVRLDADKLKIARDHGIDCADLFRGALDKEIAKATGKCPICNQVVRERMKGEKR